MRAPVGPRPVARAGRAVPITEEQIRARAYQLYRQRGPQPGAALEDWLQAEEELLASLGQRAVPVRPRVQRRLAVVGLGQAARRLVRSVRTENR